MSRRSEYSDCDEIVDVCSALSNRKRVCLLRNLGQMGEGTLREIHDRTSADTGISHRETTHTYLENLQDAGLIEKFKHDSGDIHYQVAVTGIDVHLVV